MYVPKDPNKKGLWFKLKKLTFNAVIGPVGGITLASSTLLFSFFTDETRKALGIGSDNSNFFKPDPDLILTGLVVFAGIMIAREVAKHVEDVKKKLDDEKFQQEVKQANQKKIESLETALEAERKSRKELEEKYSNQLWHFKTMPSPEDMKVIDAILTPLYCKLSLINADLITAIETGNIDFIDNLLRDCLHVVTCIAENHGHSSLKHARLAANLFIRHPLPFEHLLGVEDIFHESILPESTSILRSHPDLSCVLQHPDAEPTRDPLIKAVAIALPHPAKLKTKMGRQRYLIGAPQALIEGTCFIEDTHKFQDMVNQTRYRGIAADEFYRLGDYCMNDERGLKVRSIASLAIYKDSYMNAPIDPIAVLNVHADQPGMFNTHLGISFFNSVRPIINIAYDLLLARDLCNAVRKKTIDDARSWTTTALRSEYKTQGPLGLKF